MGPQDEFLTLRAQLSIGRRASFDGNLEFTAACLADTLALLTANDRATSFPFWRTDGNVSFRVERRRAQVPPSRPANSPSLDELLLFFPAKFPAGDYRPAGLAFEDAWLSAPDGTKLHGWYCPAERPRAAVLFLHGNAGNVSHRAPRLARLQRDLHVSVLALDYRGYGRSEGRPTADGVLQDARAARKFLVGRVGVPEGQVVLMGESLGGAVAADLAGDGARGMVLESTFSSLRDVAAHHYPRLAWLVPEGKLNSAAKLAGYRGPLLQSHGDADRTIPYALGRKLFEAAATQNKEFFTVAGGDHNDARPPEYYQALDRFIEGLPKQ